MKAKTMPTLASIEEGRSNQEIYMRFCDLFLCDVVKRTKYTRSMMLKKFTDFVTRTDEAFCILVVVNNWDRAHHWATEELAGTDKEVIMKHQPKTKFTMEGGNAPAGGGWMPNGLEEMTRLYELVDTDRLGQAGRAFNKYFMDQKTMVGPKKRKSTKTGPSETEEEKKKREVPNDFDSDDDDDDSLDNGDNNENKEE
jgi:hypothetical protein